MRLPWRVCLLLCATLLGVVGCASNAALKRTARVHALYSEMVMHDLKAEQDLALESLNQAFQLDPANERLALELARRHAQRTNREAVLAVLRKAAAQPAPSENVLSQLGGLYLAQGRTNLALKVNRAAIKANPAALVGYQNLYVLHLEAGRTNEALASLQQAGAAKNVAPEFFVGLAEIYTGFGRRAPARWEESRKLALASLANASALQPTNSLTQLRIADGFLLLNDLRKALPIYEQLAAGTETPAALQDNLRTKLIDLYLLTGERAKAVGALKELVTDDPANAQAYYQLSRLAAQTGNRAEAVDYLQKAILFRPEIETGYYALAMNQIEAGDPRGSLDTLARARARFTQSFLGEYLAGLAFARLKEFTNALNHYTVAEGIARASDTNVLNQHFYFELGIIFERLGDQPEAVKHFQRCIELDPKFAEALNYLGYLWADRGEHLEQARDLIERAVKEQPDNDAFIDSLGWVLFKLGKPEEALKQLLEAARLAERPDPEMSDHLGEVYRALGQLDKAAESWQKSLELAPNDAIRKKLEALPAR